MASIDQFAIPQGWRITGWGVDKTGSIPKNTFTVGGSLVIGIVQGPTPSCGLAWLNLDGKPCSMTDLPFQEGSLNATDFPVSIEGMTINCSVTLWIDNGRLKGKLERKEGKTDVVDGNTGTFAADAHPVG